MSITAVILTFNEELHLKRCLQSLQKVCSRICIVDSFSTDNTLAIAQEMGVDIYQNKWDNNYAKQLNWGLENCNVTTPWTMRMDADEYLSEELQDEILEKIDNLSSEISGIEYNRKVIFKGKWIKNGGFYPITLLRIWKTGLGTCEQRMMDEHIVINSGSVIKFKNDVVDENLNDIHWWVSKHNNYARREAVDILNREFKFLDNTIINTKNTGNQAVVKRFMKNKVYNNLPIGLRPFLYFIFRMVFRLGFLDGTRGFMFHFMQGFWYRFLVDINVYEAKKQSKNNSEAIKAYIQNNWKIEI